MKTRIFTFIALFVFSLSFNHSFAATMSAPYSVSDSSLLNDPDAARLKKAAEEFRSLSKKEKRELVREAKKEIRLFKAEKKAGKEASTNTLLLVVVAILLPPLAVYLHDGVINTHFWIALLLTLLFWLPGVIYALVIILS